MPLLVWQGRGVRARALQLPEAAGARQGRVGAQDSRPLRLLIVGDSSAAGVGAATQDQALAGQLAAALARHLGRAVQWQLVATTGHTARDAVAALRDLPSLQRADVLVTVLGVNDAVSQRTSAAFVQAVDALHQLAVQRAGVQLAWHCGLPPMGRFPLLPQPLRWVLGRDAARLDAALRRHVAGRPNRHHAPLPSPPADAAVGDWMAADGFHPGPLGYAAWGEQLAAAIAGRAQSFGI